jgi:hypothetical protein
MQKTRAALSYYTGSITSNNGVNMFYYLGDQSGDEVYENYEGGINQKNKAHFLEMSSALSILDFMDVHPKLNPQEDNYVKEFGIRSNKRTIELNDLGSHTFEKIAFGLSQFYLMRMYMKLGFDKTKIRNVQWQQSKNNGITPEKLSDQFLNNLYGFFEHFDTWIKELEENDVSFNPFYLDRGFSNALEFIRSITPRKIGLDRSPTSLKWLDEFNVQLYPELKKISSEEARLIHLFERSTEKLLEKKFKMH